MVQYIYFVKCPNCEDEHFYSFDEAKACAMGCLNKKPIITQIETHLNDFNECVDSCDLGTVWSWEELMDDDNIPIADLTAFSKADTFGCADCDKEFDELDNSLDFVPDNFRKPVPADMTVDQLVEEMEENEDTVECTWCEELYDKSECRYEVDLGWLCHRCQGAIMSRGEPLTFRENNYWDFLDEGIIPNELFADRIDSSTFEIWGITQTSDTAYEAALLKRFENVSLLDPNATQVVYDEMYRVGGAFVFLFNKSGVPELNAWNIGLLREIGRCEITFDDAQYEEALDAVFNKHALTEATEKSESTSWICVFDDREVGLVEAATEEEALEKMMIEYPEYNYSMYDGCYNVYPADELNESSEGDNTATPAASSGKPVPWTHPPVELEYSNLEVTLQGKPYITGGFPGWQEWDEAEDTVEHTYTVDANSVAEVIWELLTPADVTNVPGGLSALEADGAYDAFLATDFDRLVDKYMPQILAHFEDSAREDYESNHGLDDPDDYSDYPDEY